MALASAMYYSGRNPLRTVRRDSESVTVVRGARQRRLHKALLRYHDPDNWPLIRDTLKAMGKAGLIGYGKRHLVPPRQPAGYVGEQDARGKAGHKAGRSRPGAQRDGEKGVRRAASAARGRPAVRGKRTMGGRRPQGRR